MGPAPPGQRSHDRQILKSLCLRGPSVDLRGAAFGQIPTHGSNKRSRGSRWWTGPRNYLNFVYLCTPYAVLVYSQHE